MHGVSKQILEWLAIFSGIFPAGVDLTSLISPAMIDRQVGNDQHCLRRLKKNQLGIITRKEQITWNPERLPFKRVNRTVCSSQHLSVQKRPIHSGLFFIWEHGSFIQQEMSQHKQDSNILKCCLGEINIWISACTKGILSTAKFFLYLFFTSLNENFLCNWVVVAWLCQSL